MTNLDVRPAHRGCRILPSDQPRHYWIEGLLVELLVRQYLAHEELENHVGPDQPVFGIQSVELVCGNPDLQQRASQFEVGRGQSASQL